LRCPDLLPGACLFGAWLLGAALLAAALLGACLPPDYGTAPFACQKTGACPGGYSCYDGICRRSPPADGSLVDAPVPDLPRPDGQPSCTYAFKVLPRVTTSFPDLYDVWGSAADQMFVVGAGKTVLQGGVSVWKQLTLQATLAAIHGTGPKEVYAVGSGGKLWRYTGTWSASTGPATSAPLTDVWASGPKDIYVTSGTALHHYDGSQWKQLFSASGQLRAIRGVKGQLFAVGTVGTIYRRVGGAWQKEPPVTTANLNDVWGSSSSNVIVVGDSGEILRFDSTSWRRVNTSAAEHLNAIWGRGPDDLVVVGNRGTILRLDSTGRWTLPASPTTAHLDGVWGSGPGSVLAVGATETILEGTCE
jgi:hypothetical protein